ncbi:MAG: hypothetical protein JNM97_19130 [Rhodoferax sp.]|nr:hypothetical protein [Rhodoferax sp.]
MLATVVRETNGAMARGSKIGCTRDFFGCLGLRIAALPTLSGDTIEGMVVKTLQ